MALNSINTNIGAYYAQMNIGKASTSASLSIARLSSGSRIVRAADDVAALSAGTSLQTNVTTLRTALLNTSQGSSLLQVADGALGQITDILQRQKAIAVQAGSGSLSDAERSFLNQEFQNLTEEIDRLATQTNFNGVNLLDGILTRTVQASSIDTAADSSSASVSFTVNAADGETLILNGQTVTMDLTPTVAQVQIGASISETLDNLVTFLNASTNTDLSLATYSRSGNSLVITAKSGGVQGQNYIVSGAGTWTDNADSAVLGGPNAGSFITAFTVAVGAANADDAAVGAASATIPFNTGDALTAQIGGGAVNTLTTLVVGWSLNDIIDDINSTTDVHGITAYLTGNSGNYNIILHHANPDLDNEAAAADGGDITLGGLGASVDNTGAAIAFTAAAGTTHIRISGLGDGGETGIGAGDTIGVGTIGNDILTDQVQTRSEITVLFPDITPANLETTLAPTTTTAFTLRLGDPGTAGEFVDFIFSTNSSTQVGPTEIAIGATLEETLDNAVETINKYVGTGVINFDLDQLRARRDGNNLIIETVRYGTATHLDLGGGIATETDINLVNAPTGVSITSNGTLDNGVTTGVTTTGVTNADFVGTIQGFEAVYNNTADTVNLEITVGGYTYSALDVGTVVTADTTVRLTSQDGGGYFDIQLQANNGTGVTSQGDADTFANRLDAAFSTLTFYQNRNVASYSGLQPIVTDGEVTGSLSGTVMKMQLTDFSDVKINDIEVTAPSGSNVNGSVVFTINGEEFTSANNIGGQFGAHQTYQFVSASDASRFVEFTTGDNVIDFSEADKAASFEAALEEAFGVGEGNEALQFQVGVTTSDTLRISISGVTADDLDIGSLDVLTQATASAAADALDIAIDAVTSVRAEVGALQSRFGFAAANVESSIQNQDAARGVLLDTDVAAESTAFATAQVKLQAGIAVLAQANLLQQNLLKLIG